MTPSSGLRVPKRNMPLSIVTWKWGSLYSVEYVNTLRNMLERHLKLEHQMFCITDDPTDIDERVTVLPMFPDTFPGMTSTSGHRANFRRLKTFDRELIDVFGPRMLQLDLDIVILDDITTLLDRPEPLVCFDQMHGNLKRRKLNTSMVLMDTGVLGQMWKEFVSDPEEVWGRVKTSGVGDGNNSDQAVFGFYARELNPPTWGEPDVAPFYKVKNNDGAGLPVGCRAVLFFGDDKPHHLEMQKKCPWIGEHWK